MSDVHVATKNAYIVRDGERIRIQEGVSRVREGHWLLDEHPDMFKPIDVQFDVEQATAAPGEKRGTPTCDECGFEAKTVAGLGAHKRSHD